MQRKKDYDNNKTRKAEDIYGIELRIDNSSELKPSTRTKQARREGRKYPHCYVRLKSECQILICSSNGEND